MNNPYIKFGPTTPPYCIGSIIKMYNNYNTEITAIVVKMDYLGKHKSLRYHLVITDPPMPYPMRAIVNHEGIFVNDDPAEVFQDMLRRP